MTSDPTTWTDLKASLANWLNRDDLSTMIQRKTRGPKIAQFLSIIRGVQDIMLMLVFGGVFERHPRLKVVCAEADAGWVPHFMYRMDHAYSRHRHWLEVGKLTKPPSEYFAQNEGRWANGLNGVAQLEARVTPTFDAAYRRAQIDKAYGSVFAALLERRLGATGISDREPLVTELPLREVLRLRQLTPDAVDGLARRIGDKLSRKLRDELPDAARHYVAFVERELGVPVELVGVGAARERVVV